jgi:hypothetical protein
MLTGSTPSRVTLELRHGANVLWTRVVDAPAAEAINLSGSESLSVPGGSGAAKLEVRVNAVDGTAPDGGPRAGLPATVCVQLYLDNFRVR